MLDERPVADMRRIKLVDMNGLRYASKSILCNYCGYFQHCEIKMEKYREWDSKRMKDCKAFVPIIPFRPPLNGFEGAFNTFRMGPAWTKRVVRGSKVALYNTKDGNIFGYAEVKAVFFGPKEEMAEQHGKNNHLLLGYDGELTVKDKMLKVLRNSFGKLIYTSHSHATVMYLERF